ncbi:MAG: phosphotransferase family protein [Ilumatobacteraceae bacterium]
MAVTDRIRLEGGYHNDVWKVRRDGRTLVEKRYAVQAEPNPMYPNLPAQEALALRSLAGTGCAPAFVDFVERDADGRALLTYAFVPGAPWRRGVEDVARLLHTVHRVPVPRGLRRIPATPAGALESADAMVDAVPHRLSSDLRAVRPDLSRRAAASRPAARSVVHTDCGPGNVMRGRRGVVLIDWQCPGAGDPVEDLACFRSPAMMILYGQRPHSTATVRRFLAAYASLDSAAAASVQRHAEVGAAWHYRIGAYCVWRIHRLSRTQPDVAERYRQAMLAEIDLLSSPSTVGVA